MEQIETGNIEELCLDSFLVRDRGGYALIDKFSILNSIGSTASPNYSMRIPSLRDISCRVIGAFYLGENKDGEVISRLLNIRNYERLGRANIIKLFKRKS